MDGLTAAAVLGVTNGASGDTIRSAFRARAKATHPDLGGTATSFAATLDAFHALHSRSTAPINLTSTPHALAATHGFVGYDMPAPPRSNRRKTFADELRIAVAREAAAAHR